MYFLLSKLLPLFLLPLGLSFICLLAGLFSRRRFPLFFAASILWFFSLGVVSQRLWSLLEYPYTRVQASEAPQADAIVVLSTGRHPAPGYSRITEWHDPDRFLAGIDLFRAGKAPRLFFTGGFSPLYSAQLPDGDHHLQEAISLGIPASSVATTPPVFNTAQEAIAIRKLLPSNRFRILLVTSAFHMRRSKRLFERQGLDVVSFPVDFQARGPWAGAVWRDPIQWLPSTWALDNSTRALRELMGRAFYRSF